MIEFASLPKERIDTEHVQRVVRSGRNRRVSEMPSRVDNRHVPKQRCEDRLGWAERATLHRPEYDRLEFSTPESAIVRNFGRAWVEGVAVQLDSGTELPVEAIDGRRLACRFLGESHGRTDERELHVTSADPAEVYG